MLNDSQITNPATDPGGRSKATVPGHGTGRASAIPVARPAFSHFRQAHFPVSGVGTDDPTRDDYIVEAEACERASFLVNVEDRITLPCGPRSARVNELDKSAARHRSIVRRHSYVPRRSA